MYVKLFYWMRLFDDFAAFIRILSEIVVDTVPFMVFLVICIGMFSNSLLLLDQSRRLNGIDAPIDEPVFGFAWLDAFVRQYLVGLGEFGMDNFGEQDGTLVWIMFLLATLVTQLLFMNLLIAIMGDTFARVQEMKLESATKERVAMISDFMWVLDVEKEFAGMKYVLLVRQ